MLSAVRAPSSSSSSSSTSFSPFSSTAVATAAQQTPLSSGSRQMIQRLGSQLRHSPTLLTTAQHNTAHRSALLRSACPPKNGPAGAWGSAVVACLNKRINTQSQSTRGSTHTQTGEQCERGSAFPDVCCSFDLLLQLKLHPPPASLTCCHSNTSTRIATTPSLQPTL
ncbi:hypothetical protein Q5P01_022409 [Channa striata]|uniref:Uncharacterized protein n=1 Tax=Channa striata TaxID=64152 RepID=A0AA88LPR1_CHASR|nr:hypothetical protein Q5P01_022409 [Channa striata]